MKNAGGFLRKRPGKIHACSVSHHALLFTRLRFCKQEKIAGSTCYAPPEPAQKLGTVAPICHTSAPPLGDQSREGALLWAPRPASLLSTAVYRSDPVSDKVQGNDQHLNLLSALQTYMHTSTLTYMNVHVNIVHIPQKRKLWQNTGPLFQNRTRSQNKPPSNILNL